MNSISEIPNTQLAAGDRKQHSVVRREADLDRTASGRCQFGDELMLLIIAQPQRTVAGAQSHKRAVCREGGGRGGGGWAPLSSYVCDRPPFGGPDKILPRGAIDADKTLGGPIAASDVRGRSQVERTVTAVLFEVPNLDRAIPTRRRESFAVRRDGQSPDRATMAMQYQSAPHTGTTAIDDNLPSIPSNHRGQSVWGNRGGLQLFGREIIQISLLSVAIPAGEIAVGVSHDDASARMVERNALRRARRAERLAPRFPPELNVPDPRRRNAGPARRRPVRSTGQDPPVVRGNVEVLDAAVMPLEASHALVRVSIPNDDHSAVICRRQKAAVRHRARR